MTLTFDHLSPHFTLAEMTRTSTGLPNVPAVLEAASMVLLCYKVLEPWRARTGPLAVTSGYRSPAVNEAVNGSRTSQHMRGEAADIKPVSVTLEHAWAELLSLIAGGLPVDQAIVYERAKGRGWVHVSRSFGRQPRGQLLVQPAAHRGVYVPWADWSGPVVIGG